jgi:DNA/RNA endonuclease G (NUC1)
LFLKKFINVAPQWEIFNGRNWKKLEIGIQKKTFQLNKPLRIWTGTLDELRLQDKSKASQQIFLDFDPKRTYQRVRVPKYFFKIVMTSDKRNGVVFVGA